MQSPNKLSNSIFNPESNYVIPPVVHASEWPATEGAQELADNTYYRVTTWDHQGRYDDEHSSRRRVYSVRESYNRR